MFEAPQAWDTVRITIDELEAAPVRDARWIAEFPQAARAAAFCRFVGQIELMSGDDPPSAWLGLQRRLDLACCAGEISEAQHAQLAELVLVRRLYVSG
jgi:hypothetical protein